MSTYYNEIDPYAAQWLRNLIAAGQLIEAAEEQSLGITRNEFMLTYAVVLAVGVALVVAGLCWRK